MFVPVGTDRGGGQLGEPVVEGGPGQSHFHSQESSQEYLDQPRTRCRIRGTGRPRVASTVADSPLPAPSSRLDQALAWDIKGKHCGVPVYHSYSAVQGARSRSLATWIGSDEPGDPRRAHPRRSRQEFAPTKIR